jgi:anthranilate phosphoribosyltransferase
MEPADTHLDPEAPIGERRRLRSDRQSANERRLRELLAAIGSGERTGRNLSREEAAEALELLLAEDVNPAQAGAFLIAHRLRRPQPQELAGMLDTYRRLGPTLEVAGRRTVSFGVPFDGRSRTAPILPLTALLLAAAGLGVVLQGGDPMPVKYGLTQAEALAALELDLRGLAWPRVQDLFKRHGLALLHQPHHFPAAERLVPLRMAIGKRPPIATLELLWSCCPDGDLQVSGFVHAPTEALIHDSLASVGTAEVITIKGLEGGVDLPISRVAIAAHRRGCATERLILQARDYGLRSPEPELHSLAVWCQQGHAALQGEGPLLESLLWNGGFQLWRSGLADDLAAGVAAAERLVREGAVEAIRREIQEDLDHEAKDDRRTGDRWAPTGVETSTPLREARTGKPRRC